MSTDEIFLCYAFQSIYTFIELRSRQNLTLRVLGLGTMSYFPQVLLLGGLTLSAILPASSTSSQNQSSERITPLSSAEVAAFKPYTQFANAAYCQPSTTLAWNCGASCAANPTFMPVASGGDGAVTQFCASLLRPLPGTRLPGLSHSAAWFRRR